MISEIITTSNGKLKADGVRLEWGEYCMDKPDAVRMEVIPAKAGTHFRALEGTRHESKHPSIIRLSFIYEGVELTKVEKMGSRFRGNDFVSERLMVNKEAKRRHAIALRKEAFYDLQ